MATEVVRVEGLPELIRALGRVERKAGAELRKELRTTVGAAFVQDVKQAIDSRGLVRSGRLRSSIKPSVRGGDIYVRSSPPLKPGRRSRMGYAAVYEYGHGGRRAYLEPTREEWLATGKLKRELSGYLDFVAEEFRA